MKVFWFLKCAAEVSKVVPGMFLSVPLQTRARLMVPGNVFTIKPRVTPTNMWAPSNGQHFCHLGRALQKKLTYGVALKRYDSARLASRETSTHLHVHIRRHRAQQSTARHSASQRVTARHSTAQLRRAEDSKEKKSREQKRGEHGRAQRDGTRQQQHSTAPHTTPVSTRRPDTVHPARPQFFYEIRKLNDLSHIYTFFLGNFI